MLASLSDSQREFARFIVNGVAAAAVHFCVLSFLILVAKLPSAGAANFLAAIAGMSASFLGSRYFVFRNHTAGVGAQLWRFAAFYALFALVHAGVLYLWSDLWGLDFRIGFILATGLQVLMSFSANKLLVFAR
jgi:putative flippase GtrA